MPTRRPHARDSTLPSVWRLLTSRGNPATTGSTTPVANCASARFNLRREAKCENHVKKPRHFAAFWDRRESHSPPELSPSYFCPVTLAFHDYREAEHEHEARVPPGVHVVPPSLLPPGDDRPEVLPRVLGKQAQSM